MRRALFIGLCIALTTAGCGRPGEREYAAGLRALARGRYVEARALLEKSIQRRPGAAENARAYNYLGIACQRQNETAAAAAAFQESRRLDPSRWEPAYNLGVIYAAAADDVRAATLFEEAAMADPTAALPLEYLGHIYSRRGRWAEARAALLEALARDPRSPSLLTRLAVVEFRLNGADAALTRLSEALSLQPDYPPALFGAFSLEARRPGRRAEAIAYGRRFLAAAREHPRAAEIREFIAAIAPDATSTAAASPSSSAPPRASPPAPTAPVTSDWRTDARQRAERGDAEGAARACLQAAEAARRRGDAAEQEAALRAAVELAFDQPSAHAAWGRYLLDGGEAESALRSLRQAQALGDHSESTLMALVEAAQRAGEADAALVTLRRLAQRPNAGADVVWRLAEFYDRELLSSEDALREYRTFMARFPGDARVVRARERVRELARPPAEGPLAAPPPPAETVPAEPAEPPPQLPLLTETASAPERRLQWRPGAARNPAAAAQAYNRASEYYRQGDRDRAIFFFTRAIENDDSLAEAFLGLGAIYLETGDAELAKDAYRLALERRPGDAAARYNYALALQKLRQREAALAETARVLREQPDYAPAHYLAGTLLAEDPARLDEARAHFLRFLALAPNDPNAPAVRRWLGESR